MCLDCDGITNSPNFFSCVKFKKYPHIPSDCNSFDFSGCKILENLPFLLGLTFLRCDRCPNLTKLPSLPNLTFLSCFRSGIISLPNLPESLTFLDCGRTAITFLPDLPKNLVILRVDHTRIKSLGNLPESLETLWFSDTLVTDVPKFPKNLKAALCTRTRLSKIPFHSLETIVTCFECPWLDVRFKDRESRFQKLRKIQKCVKKFLFRRKVRIFSFFRKIFPREIIGLILSIN